MNRKSSLLIIILVFALPVLLYYATRSHREGISTASSVAEAANKPKVLHFSQQMCSECRTLEGIMQPVENEYKNQVVFVHIDVSDRQPANEALIQKYKVRVVPTLVFINKNGKVIKRTEGSMPKEELEGYLNSIIK